MRFGGGAELVVSATNQALIAAGLRASYPAGILTPVYLEGGTDQWGYAYDDARITDLTLNLAQGAEFRAGINWTSLGIATSAGSTHPTEVNPPLEDWRWAATWEGNEYGILSAAIRLGNNVDARTNFDARAPGSRRWPQFFLMGPEDFQVDLVCGRPLPDATLDIWEDDLPTNLGMILTGSDGTHTCTITLSDLQPMAGSMGWVDGRTQVAWACGFQGNEWAGSLDWAWV